MRRIPLILALWSGAAQVGAATSIAGAAAGKICIKLVGAKTLVHGGAVLLPLSSPRYLRLRRACCR